MLMADEVPINLSHQLDGVILAVVILTLLAIEIF